MVYPCNLYSGSLPLYLYGKYRVDGFVRDTLNDWTVVAITNINGNDITKTFIILEKTTNKIKETESNSTNFIENLKDNSGLEYLKEDHKSKIYFVCFLKQVKHRKLHISSAESTTLISQKFAILSFFHQLTQYWLIAMAGKKYTLEDGDVI